MSAPPICRGSMVAQPWYGLARGIFHGLLLWLSGSARSIPAQEPAPWERAAVVRRRLSLALIALITISAAGLFAKLQPVYANAPLQYGQLALFAVLFAWVASGFVTALMGFVVQLRGDRHGLSRVDVMDRPIADDARTAIIMPICNEHVATAFAGLRATWQSLTGTGAHRFFDVYVLSDSTDPDIRRAESAAWAELRAAFGQSGRIFYRLRRRRTKRKAGNVADFCRRWGRNYRYMVVLDADSIMSGDCLVHLVRLMEALPSAGIIQTAPQSVGHGTLHARAQQFASRVTGRLFMLGMQYWQLGESHYWGHNAIIRVEPFMKHCGLAALPGKGPLSGEVLSHDFVEAALMRRAGYHVWLAPNLSGSYEQQPPNLMEELRRDRRWCQGNLQNVRLIAEPGLHPVHRAMLATGAMAYLAAPLWLAFVALGALVWLPASLTTTISGLRTTMAVLWLCMLTMLMLPRVLGVLTVVLKGEQHCYGGVSRLIKSALLEAGLSLLQAPVRLVAHTTFVLGALTGWRMEWKSPPREAQSIDWRDAALRFAPICGTGAALLAAVASTSAPTLLWLTPAAVPLLLVVPLSVLTSYDAPGARRRGLLLIPEESKAPAVLQQAWAYVTEAAVSSPLGQSLS